MEWGAIKRIMITCTRGKDPLGRDIKTSISSESLLMPNPKNGANFNPICFNPLRSKLQPVSTSCPICFYPQKSKIQICSDSYGMDCINSNMPPKGIIYSPKFNTYSQNVITYKKSDHAPPINEHFESAVWCHPSLPEIKYPTPEFGLSTCAISPNYSTEPNILWNIVFSVHYHGKLNVVLSWTAFTQGWIISIGY